MSKPTSKEVASSLGVSQRHARRLIAADDFRIYPAAPPQPKPCCDDALLIYQLKVADGRFEDFVRYARRDADRYTDGADLLKRTEAASNAIEHVMELVYGWGDDEAKL